MHKHVLHVLWVGLTVLARAKSG